MKNVIAERYEFGEVVASGGMATVWRARDTRLDRDVAVKRPHPTRQDDPERERIVREARAAASIAHPNIVTVFDVGEDEDGPYLVMELVEAPRLDDVGADLDSSQAVAMVASVASALDAVHRAGIVHRDVKPSNILMAESGPKLTDFGIAHDPTVTQTLTLDGQVIATPQYAAPEVLAGGTPTPAADVFSLAAVAYELLSGRPPFEGTERTSTPAPIGHASIDGVLASALAPDPDERPEAAVFGLQLSGAAPTVPIQLNQTADPGPGVAPTLPLATIPMATLPSSPPGGEEPPEPRRRRLGPWMLAGIFVLALLIAATAATLDSSEPVSAAVATSTTTSTPTTTTTTSTTTTTTTTLPEPTVESVRQDLATLINSIHPSELKPKDGRSILDKIDEAIERAADAEDPDKVADKLESAAEDVEDKVEGDARDAIRSKLDELAGLLGVEF